MLLCLRSSALLGRALVRPLVRSCCWRSNRYGAVAGMIAGAVMVFLWKYCIADLAPVLKIYELLPAFLFGLLVNVVVSLCTPAPDKEVLEQYDAVKAEK